jgi:D-alanine-D-alanine ligase-like ATP-grasp enzyme
VDIVLDAQQGPLILELNARPGLAIQIANGQGLQARVYSVIKETKHYRTSAERVVFSMNSFQNRST